MIVGTESTVSKNVISCHVGSNVKMKLNLCQPVNEVTACDKECARGATDLKNWFVRVWYDKQPVPVGAVGTPLE